MTGSTSTFGAGRLVMVLLGILMMAGWMTAGLTTACLSSSGLGTVVTPNVTGLYAHDARQPTGVAQAVRRVDRRVFEAAAIAPGPVLALRTSRLAAEGGGAARVFWSGSAEARQAAADWAASSGGQALEMTARGQELAASNLEWTEAKALWQQASRKFAQGASGDVHVFHAAEGVRIESMWARIEYPILNDNPAVNLIYHVVGGG